VRLVHIAVPPDDPEVILGTSDDEQVDYVLLPA
jgi:hypothetical protein